MAFSIHLTEQEEKLAKAYAATHNISLNEAFKQALFEKIEDEFDLGIAKEAYEEYLDNTVEHSLEDLMREEKIRVTPYRSQIVQNTN